MEKEEAGHWADSILGGWNTPVDDDTLSNASCQVIASEHHVLRGMLISLPSVMPDLDELFAQAARGTRVQNWRGVHYFSKLRAVICELLQEPTAPCPVCKGEQEITERGFEQPDMDGSSFCVPDTLACGHPGPAECEISFSMGPAHDPYGVTCYLDSSLHTRINGTLVHEGYNPLAAPGQEIICWTGGGYCAGDPLPHEITGYKPAEKRQPSWLEALGAAS